MDNKTKYRFFLYTGLHNLNNAYNNYITLLSYFVK